MCLTADEENTDGYVQLDFCHYDETQVGNNTEQHSYICTGEYSLI